ncbi:sel1 repeat family protein [Aeromonas piscicola]|uniref:Sel1 repeat family protein n=1 Tax=Aeromonas piscicola TaxID=600645 RepID=A0ABT7QAA9_9GAMM|nr:tetratricopeptide repeat protein [Aeromonas piscicola]MDM5130882.1 sel1 repeat family protein [Aeromonas piscicola]
MNKSGFLKVIAGWLWCVFNISGCSSLLSSQDDQEIHQAAQQGQGKAQYELANRLAAKPDYPEAMRWMKQAAEQTGPLAADADIRGKAALQVGRWYQVGLGEPKNPQLAENWWQRSAKLGNREASYQLGRNCQQQHKGKLISECLDWFEQAANRDHAEAQLILGQWYAKQPGADADAVKWLEKAAERGNRDAQYQWGLRYEQGKGVSKRSDVALRWFEKAAAQQQPDALLILARKAAPEEAFSFYQRAANAGSAPAQLWLGQAYLAGEKVVQDLALGRYWLELAAGNGSHEAEYQLSLQQSDAAAREHWLTRAAEGGFSQAQLALAEWLQERGDLAAARQHFSQAAAQGNVDARYAYGEMLRLGLGGKEDYAQALKQYRLAANAHHRSAQYRMGMMREQGLGAPRNRLHAYAWYLLAATDGNHDATKARDELEKGMTEKEKSAGQKLAQHWFVTLAQGKKLES